MINKVVLSVDRKSTLSTEDILCGLVRGDQGEPFFPSPKNEDEQNINNRFLCFSFV